MAIKLDLQHNLPSGDSLKPWLSDLIEHFSDEDRDFLLELWGSYIDHVANEYIKLFTYSLSKSIEDIPELLRTRWVPVSLKSAPSGSGETARGEVDKSTTILLWLVENIISQKRRYERGKDYKVEDGVVVWYADPPNLFFDEDVTISGTSTTFAVSDSFRVSDISIDFSGTPHPSKIYLKSPGGTIAVAFSQDPEELVSLDILQSVQAKGTWELIVDGSYTGTASVKFYRNLMLWGEYAYQDDNRLFDNFGILVNFQRESSELYKEQLLAIFNAFWSGPALQLIQQGVNAILTLPNLKEAGTVVSISPSETILSAFNGIQDISPALADPAFNSTLWTGATPLTIGQVDTFDAVEFTILTAAIGSGSVIAEYWDGSEWSTLSDLSDLTETGGDSFAQDGKISFQIPGNWVKGGPGISGLPSDKFFIRLTPSSSPGTDPEITLAVPEKAGIPFVGIGTVVVMNTDEIVYVPEVLTLDSQVVVGADLPRFFPLTTAVTIQDRISEPTYLDDSIYDIAIQQFVESTTLTTAQIKEILKGNVFVVNIDPVIGDVIGPTGFNVDDIGQFVLSLKPAYTAFFIRFGDTLIGVDLSVLNFLNVTSITGSPFDYTHRLKTDAAFEAVQVVDFATYEASPSSYPEFSLDDDAMSVHDDLAIAENSDVDTSFIAQTGIIDVTSILIPTYTDGQVIFISAFNDTVDVTADILADSDALSSTFWAAGVPLFIGHTSIFTKLNVDLLVAAIGSGALIVDYWNGSTWASLTVTDGTFSAPNTFAIDGQITFTAPGPWATGAPGLSPGRYYLRLTPTSTPGTLPDVDKFDVEDGVGAIISSIQLPFNLKIGQYIYRMHNDTYLDPPFGDNGAAFRVANGLDSDAETAVLDYEETPENHPGFVFDDEAVVLSERLIITRLSE